jgi:hypothetical protein
MGVEENKEIARDLIEALGRADKARVLDLYAEDCCGPPERCPSQASTPSTRPRG